MKRFLAALLLPLLTGGCSTSKNPDASGIVPRAGVSPASVTPPTPAMVIATLPTATPIPTAVPASPQADVKEKYLDKMHAEGEKLDAEVALLRERNSDNAQIIADSAPDSFSSASSVQDAAAAYGQLRQACDDFLRSTSQLVVPDEYREFDQKLRSAVTSLRAGADDANRAIHLKDAWLLGSSREHMRQAQSAMDEARALSRSR